ncbi:MAG: helix-turn-helix transcriptional regulator [Lachnospiraceae bacterium]|nr:helix-turn-helix transcriptional regulator [Lachnospiraceae bacterium]
MTWEEYKTDVKNKDKTTETIIEEAEVKSAIITAMISRRNDLGMSQRDLAELCGIPQSSVARIESNRSVPKLDTLIKILAQLGLGLTVMPLQK